MPKVSIVVPIYNQEKYLHQCLSSLVNQTLEDIEIICVNDGSKDASLQILEEFKDKDSRIKIFNKENSGYGNTMNVGFDAATGEYIGILESDDYADLDMFEKMYNAAKEHDVDVVKTNFYYLFKDKSDFVEVLPANSYDKPFSPKDNQLIFTTEPAIWSALYRTDFIRRNSLRFLETAGASYQDTSFNFKVLASADKIILLKNGFVHYRQDNECSSVNQKDKVFCICHEFQAIEDFLDMHSEQKETFEAVKNYVKFKTYDWNLKRIDISLKHLFIEKMAFELSRDADIGKVSKDFFSAHEWKKYNKIKKEHQLYLKKLAFKEKFKNLNNFRRSIISVNIKKGRIKVGLLGRKVIDYTFSKRG